MIKAFVIDDEQDCIDSILELTKHFQGTLAVVGTFTNVDDALIATKQLLPDLVFLDVEMTGKTGFDYLKEVGEINFNIIFTTGHEKYALKAIQFSALAYLLKPIDMDDFKKAIVKIKEAEDSKLMDKKIETYLHNYLVKNEEKRIVIHSKEDCHVLYVSEIEYCKASINYTDIHLINNAKLNDSKTLKYYDELLSDHNFYRIDQSSLVNLKYVKKYTKGKPSYVVMHNGAKLKVSLSNKEGFLKKLNNLYGK